jgi:hypothetical protein
MTPTITLMLNPTFHFPQRVAQIGLLYLICPVSLLGMGGVGAGLFVLLLIKTKTKR